jgi:capsular polysaccharide biosynthesis protein
MNDHLRVGDADRDRAAAVLRSHLAAGRLTGDEFDDRLAAALGAVTVADLRQVLIDLPGPAVTGLPDSGLERSYRRLLAFYPARHRRVHEDEMLAVLMTAAPEGRTRPGLREAADLLGGALRVWCQPARRLSWRGLLGIVAAGTVTGFLGGITVAAASSRPVTSTTLVVIGRSGPGQQPVTSAAVHAYLNRQIAIMRSHQVLARAAEAVRPAVPEQTLSREVHVTPVTDRVVQISVEAPTAAQAVIAASAVAVSYITIATEHLPPADRAGVLDPAATLPEPSFFSTVADSSALGALCGTVLGAFLALAASRQRRRFRIT